MLAAHHTTTSARDVLQLRVDSAAFFCVLPLDVVSLLCAFMFRVSPPVKAQHLSLACSINMPTPRPPSIAFAVTCDDTIVMCHYHHNKVTLYDREGERIADVGARGVHKGPIDCVADSRGRIYVAEEGARHILCFQRDGRIACVTTRVGPVDANGMDPSSDAFLLRAALHEARNFEHSDFRGMDLSRNETLLYAAEQERCCVEVFDTASGQLLGAPVRLNPPRQYHALRVLATGQLACSWTCAAISIHCGVSVFEPHGVAVRDVRIDSLAVMVHMEVDADDNLYVQEAHKSTCIVVSPHSGREIKRLHDTETGGIGVALFSDGTAAVMHEGSATVFC